MNIPDIHVRDMENKSISPSASGFSHLHQGFHTALKSLCENHRTHPPAPSLEEEKGRLERGFEKSLSSQERPARLRELTEAGGDLG
jgi:hypothetical protein